MLLLLLGCVLVGLATHQALTAASLREAQVARSLERAGRYGGFTLKEGEVTAGVGDRLVGPSVQRLAELALRLTPKSSLLQVRARLQAAGLAEVTPNSFLAAKAGLAGSCATLALLALLTGSLDLLPALVVGLGGGYAALLLPDYWLTLRFRSRRERMLVQMPEVLDLLTVSVEAGLGFDAALVRIGERLRGPLVEELQVVIHEMRIGESRANALKSFADRIDSPETTAFARSIVQADQLGIPLGRILRVQGAEIRTRRQLAAEEKAMQAPVKMLVPTAVFIFPAMFIVVLGPALLSLGETFGNL